MWFCTRQCIRVAEFMSHWSFSCNQTALILYMQRNAYTCNTGSLRDKLVQITHFKNEIGLLLVCTIFLMSLGDLVHIV